MLRRRRENELMFKERMRRVCEMGARIINIADCETAECRGCVAFPVYALSVLADNSASVAEKMGYSGAGDFRITTNIKNIMPSQVSRHTDGSILRRREVLCDLLGDFLEQLNQTSKLTFADVLQNGTYQGKIDVEYIPDDPNESNILICHIEYNMTDNTMECKCPNYDTVNKNVTARGLDDYAATLLNY